MPATATIIPSEPLTAPRRRKRRKQERETADYVAMLRRMIRAAGRRVGAEDAYGLALLLDVAKLLDDVIADAARELNEQQGYSWGDIASACGVTRQSAHKRWAAPLIEPAASSTPMAEGTYDAEPALPLRQVRRRRT